MWFSEAVSCRTKYSRLCAVLSVFVITEAAADESVIRVFEPSPLYQGTESFRYYDVVQHEPLTFNVTASCGSRDACTMIVKKSEDFLALDGGNCLIYGCTGTCSLRCTAKDDEGPTTTSYCYTIAAEFNDGVPLEDTVICVRVQNTTWVRFIGEQPSNVTSDDGRAELIFSADGYPQPLSYELSCTALLSPSLPQSRVLLSNPTGNFTLVELPNGVTSCTAVVYTGRRLAVTEPMDLLIRVNITSLGVVVGASSTAKYSSVSAGISSANSSLSAFSSATYTTVNSVPVIQQDSVKGVHVESLIAAITVPCVVVMISIALSVGLYIFFRRRRAASKESPMISAESSVPTTPCQSLQSDSSYRMPDIIINNSTINHNYYGDTYEINGPGSSIVIINEGGRVCSFPLSHHDDGDADESSMASYVNDGECVCSFHMIHHDDRDADEPSSANHIEDFQEGDATGCHPTPILRPASASILCSVELDNDETALKYPIDPIDWKLPRS